jgi:hypothetical protein
VTGERFVPFRQASIVTMCVDEVPDEEYPLVLTTGRMLEHWHTGAMTRRAGVLDAIEPQGIAAMNPYEIERRGLSIGDMITVETRRGTVEAILRADREVADAWCSCRSASTKARRTRSPTRARPAARPGVSTAPPGCAAGLRVHHVREGSRLRQVPGRGPLRGEGQEGRRPAVHAGLDDHQAVPERARADLEMLFPNAQVRMRPIDKLLIGVPAAVSG